MKTISGRPLRATRVAETLRIELVARPGADRGRLFGIRPARQRRPNATHGIMGMLDIPDDASAPTVKVLSSRSLPWLALFARRLSGEFGMPIRLVPR